MPSRDGRWLIGTVVVLAGLLIWRLEAGFAGVNARLDALDERLERLAADWDASRLP